MYMVLCFSGVNGPQKLHILHSFILSKLKCWAFSMLSFAHANSNLSFFFINALWIKYNVDYFRSIYFLFIRIQILQSICCIVEFNLFAACFSVFKIQVKSRWSQDFISSCKRNTTTWREVSIHRIRNWQSSRGTCVTINIILIL